MIASNYKSKKNQHGIVVLILIITLALATSAYYFSSISVVDVKVNNLNNTRLALKKAKQLLINYAVMHASQNGVGNGLGGGDPGEYGYLPCPYINDANEGKQNGNCGGGKNINSIGYLPWTSLQSEILRDGNGNCLWYAISGSYKNAKNSDLINEDTNGMFQIVDSNNNVIAGTAPRDRIVAVVFAPGSALNVQNRVADVNSLCGSDGVNAAAYLEGDINTNNATLSGGTGQLDQFIQASLTSDNSALPYNDYLITITRDEIWQAVMKSDLENNFEVLAEAMAVCLAEYVNHVDNPNKRLPWPASIDLDDYSISQNYDDVSGAALGYAGRFPLFLNNSNAAIINSIEDDFLNPITLAGKICTNMALPKAGLANVDLTDTKNEIRVMLNNWKDHIFYATSKAYSLPDVARTGCGASDCVSVGTTKYTAIIFFAGRTLGGQSRIFDTSSLPAVDEKNIMANYLEDGNDGKFTDITGNASYNVAGSGALPSNDIIFCLTDAVSPLVVDC